jgi:hypothetical protein
MQRGSEGALPPSGEAGAALLVTALGGDDPGEGWAGAKSRRSRAILDLAQLDSTGKEQLRVRL